MPLSGRILITGGAGFLARGIYRRASREDWRAEFTCLSRDDSKHHRLQLQYPEVQTVPGDVSTMDIRDLSNLMRGYDLVIHAAASKYVDRAEQNAMATIQTNVEGSRRVAIAAQVANTPRAIAISTDKACQPVNTYGATKLLMERIWQGQGPEWSRFTAVRYGNVVGSTGSVLTLFVRQLEEAGRILLTDPGMTRFWMSVDEAVDAIITAAAADHGQIVIPPMRASSMHDVVCAALGYDEHRSLPLGPGPGHRVAITGMRPGEKMHEAIIHRQESVRTVGPQIFRAPWLLLPPGESPRDPPEPFELTSADPPLGNVPVPELRRMVQDAEGV